MNIEEFLAARADAIETRAKAAMSERPWEIDANDRIDAPTIWSGDRVLIYDEGGHDEYDAKHIVEWQPRRVLALVASIREVLKVVDASRNDRGMDGRETPKMSHWSANAVLLGLARIWSDHPDYEERWEQ